MKRIYVTIGTRVEHEGDSPEDKGEFLVIDWETKTRVNSYSCDSGKEVTVGRSRGATGLAWHEDKIYITCRNGLMSLDPDTYEEVSRAETAHGGFHGMDSDGHTLWLTCVGTDVVLAIRDDKLQSIICTDKYGAEKGPVGDTTGPNAVGFSPSGDMFFLYAHKFQVFNWTTQKVVVEGLNDAPHDICFISDTEFLSCKSARRELVLMSTVTGEQRVVFSRLDEAAHPSARAEYVTPGWLRGIAFDKKTNAVFVCAGPGILRELDATTWELRAEYVFDTRPNSNPFDIMLDPRDWT